jgi:hypothetical protein
MVPDFGQPGVSMFFFAQIFCQKEYHIIVGMANSNIVLTPSQNKCRFQLPEKSNTFNFDQISLLQISLPWRSKSINRCGFRNRLDAKVTVNETLTEAVQMPALVNLYYKGAKELQNTCYQKKNLLPT